MKKKLSAAAAFVGERTAPEDARIRYHRGVQWIAFNDDNGSKDAENVDAIEHTLTIVLLAEVFEKTPRQVARDVVMTRTGKKVAP